jgi:hypothetical protein
MWNIVIYSLLILFSLLKTCNYLDFEKVALRKLIVMQMGMEASFCHGASGWRLLLELLKAWITCTLMQYPTPKLFP